MRHTSPRAFLMAASLTAALTTGCASQPAKLESYSPFLLPASAAKIIGANARLDTTPRETYIGYWTSTDTSVEWPLEHLSSGTYRVAILYSLDPRYPLSTIALSMSGQTLTARLASTRNWDDYRALFMGTIKVPAPANASLSIKVIDKPMTYVMNLQGVILTKEPN
jgi:hypothetical protein